MVDAKRQVYLLGLIGLCLLGGCRSTKKPSEATDNDKVINIDTVSDTERVGENSTEVIDSTHPATDSAVEITDENDARDSASETALEDENTQKDSSTDDDSAPDNEDSAPPPTDTEIEITPVLEPIDFENALPIDDELTSEALIGTYELSTGNLRMTFETDGHYYQEKYDDRDDEWDRYNAEEENRWILDGHRLTLEISHTLFCIGCSNYIEIFTAVIALLDDTLYWNVWRRMTDDDGGMIDGAWATASRSEEFFCPDCDPADHDRHGEDRIFSLTIKAPIYDLIYQPFVIGENGNRAALPMEHRDTIDLVEGRPLWMPPVEILDEMGDHLLSTTLDIDTDPDPTRDDGRRVLSIPIDNVMTWERTFTFKRVDTSE